MALIMFSQLPEAKELVKQLYAEYVSPFEVVDELNKRFEGFFYLCYGNIYRSDLKHPVADMVYDKRANLED